MPGYGQGYAAPAAGFAAYGCWEQQQYYPPAHAYAGLGLQHGEPAAAAAVQGSTVVAAAAIAPALFYRRLEAPLLTLCSTHVLYTCADCIF
jgi:hypothetical protein